MYSIDSIVAKLNLKLSPQILEVKDESDQHASHFHDVAAKGPTHVYIHCVSEQLISLSRIERHQCIYTVLKDELASGLHALRLKV